MFTFLTHERLLLLWTYIFIFAVIVYGVVSYLPISLFVLKLYFKKVKVFTLNSKGFDVCCFLDRLEMICISSLRWSESAFLLRLELTCDVLNETWYSRLTNLCTKKRAPSYLTDKVTATADLQSRAGLCFASPSKYQTPRTHIKFGERSFSYTGPSAWNSLPQHIRFISTFMILLIC